MCVVHTPCQPAKEGGRRAKGQKGGGEEGVVNPDLHTPGGAICLWREEAGRDGDPEALVGRQDAPVIDLLNQDTHNLTPLRMAMFNK